MTTSYIDILEVFVEAQYLGNPRKVRMNNTLFRPARIRLQEHREMQQRDMQERKQQLSNWMRQWQFMPPTLPPGAQDKPWIYRRRTLGDIEVWAPTKEHALHEFHRHGYRNISIADIVQGAEGSPVVASLDFERVEAK